MISIFILINIFVITFADNPDIYRTTPELIISKGFQYEEHRVVTDDGYILTLFRIINPCNSLRNNAKPVLLWHGLSSSSDLFLVSCFGSLDKNCIYSEYNRTVVNTCNDSLTGNTAFTLSSCGYDVWLGNTRGNSYSNKHVNLSVWGIDYWNFTFTELGLYDTKNSVEYILGITKRKHLAYIGNSSGTTMMFVLLSLRPQFERYIKPFIAIPGIVFLGNTDSTILRIGSEYLAPFFNNFVLGLGVPQFIRQWFAAMINRNSFLIPIVKQVIYQLFGENPYSIDHETYPSIITTLAHFSSTKIYLQYAQFIRDGGFHHFDYSSRAENIKHYGSPKPPDYPLENITSKYLVLYRGLKDALNREKDHDKLINKLTVKPLENTVIEFPYWNHVDFVYSCDNKFYLNGKILSVFKKIGI